MVIFGQISQEIDRFCADQTSVFNVFLTEDIIILLFQQQYALEMNTLRSRNELRETSEALIWQDGLNSYEHHQEEFVDSRAQLFESWITLSTG